MAHEAEQIFRLDNEVLAFRFTATLTDRAGTAPSERLDSPARLRMWLAAAHLGVEAAPTGDDLEQAVALRETIYEAGVQRASGRRPGDAVSRRLNRFVRVGSPIPQLTRGTLTWELGADPVMDALSVIARDAVHVLGGDATGVVKTCADPSCRGLFLDESRARTRRWCSMNTCGNRAKKQRLAERAVDQRPA